MAKKDFEVGIDENKVFFDDRVYNRISCDIPNVMENQTTNEKILLTCHQNLSVSQIKEKKQVIMKKFFSNVDEQLLDNDMETFEIQAIDEMNSKKELKNLIYPFSYSSLMVDDDKINFYTASELPNDFLDKYCRIDDAVARKDFSLYARVMASLNLTEIVVGLHKYFAGSIYSICPDAVFVNIENGNVKVILEKCLDWHGETCSKYEYSFETEQNEKKSDNVLEEADMLRFLGYATFRILCIEDPFDGKKTLVDYPLLTSHAIRAIHQGNYGFIAEECDNKYSEYIGKNTYAKWNVLPLFLKRAYRQIFCFGSDNGQIQMNLQYWHTQMRKLRDCVVKVNNQIRICDPNVDNKILFMSINDYKIPVWAQKAIYWYHIGVDYEEKTKGIIAGMNGEGMLQNHSQMQWGVEFDNKTVFVFPENSIKLEEGMKIYITNEVIINVINGRGDSK